MNNINSILELHQLAIKEASRYPDHRFCFESILRDTGKHFLGVTGLRGIGKSIILKQLAAMQPDSVYISIDSIGESDLFNTIKVLNQNYGISHFFLDEVHFLSNIDEILKRVYDFLDVKIIFTSSVSLGMFKSAFDLSRRVKLIKIFPFSYREYLFFNHSIKLPELSFKQIINKDWTSAYSVNSFDFDRYLRGGNMPFSLDEPDILPLLKNILKTIIQKDIPKIARLNIDELDLIDKTVTFIGKSEVDGINYSTISQNVGISKFKAQSYIELLQNAFVLHRILPAGTNILKEPKIVLAPPFRLLFKEYGECLRALREDFFIEMLASAQVEFYYLKSTRGEKTPDYLIKDGDDRIVAEVGGKGKGREQFKGIKDKKQIIFSHGDLIDDMKRPLFLAGYLT